MEDFLELAKDNTEKDLETCGTLGAFLVRFMFSLDSKTNMFLALGMVNM